GLVARAADGLRREVRAVGLGEQALGRNETRRRPKLRSLWIRYVACEGDVPAAFERRFEERRRGEAVEDDLPGKRREQREGVLVGGPGVDDGGLSELLGEPELRLERSPLGVAGRVVAEV